MKEQSIIKNRTNYSLIYNDILRNETISWEAKGLYAYLMILPDNWTIYKSEIQKHSTHKGRDAFNKIWKELESVGIIQKIPSRIQGKFSNMSYVITITPFTADSTVDWNPVTGKPPLLNTNIMTTDTDTAYPTKNDMSTYHIGQSADAELPCINSADIQELNIFVQPGKDNIKSITPINTYIEFWNTFDCFNTHKKRDTKIYKRTDTYINHLLNNRFTSTYDIDKDWRIDNNLSLSVLKQLTGSSLKKAIILYSLKFSPEYKPENKQYLPKSFADFIFNPTTGKSQLLWVLNNPPQKLHAPDIPTARKRLQEYATMIDKFLLYAYPNCSTKNKYTIYINSYKTIQEIKRIHSTMAEYNNHEFMLQLGKDTITPFVDKWLTYIGYKKHIKTIDFNCTGYTWNNFLQYLATEYKLQLDVSEKKVKKPKKSEITRIREDNDDEYLDMF
jgi:hypothetical protein